MSEAPEHTNEWEGFEDVLAQVLAEAEPAPEDPPPDRSYEQAVILGGLT